MDVATASVICRFLRDAAAMLLWGGSLYLAALVPTPLRSDLTSRFSPLRLGALGVIVLGTLALLPIEAAALGAGWRDAIDPPTIQALLFETSLGTAWLAQGSAAVLLLLAVLAPERRRDAATAGAAALLLVTLTLSGHAALHEGWLGAAHRANDALHLLAGGFWFGALPLLVLTLAASRQEVHSRDAARALRSFSRVGHGSVALVIATGVTNTALILRRWPLLGASPYQDLLVAKMAVVAAMTALAVINRYVVVPRLDRDPTRALRHIRDVTLAEIVLGLAAIALVAAFGQMEPD